MVKSGLINHGWTYINVDDYWQNHRDSKDPTLRGPFRDAQGNIVPNSRFPDMKGLADYIHGLGLKAGLVFLARPVDVRRLRRKLGSTSSRTRRLTRSGVLII